MGNEKVKSREYEIEEFEELSIEKVEKGRYDVVWKELLEKLSGKMVNSKYLKDEFLKSCKKNGVKVSEYVDSVLYGWCMRRIKDKKIEKRYDGRNVVYKFI